MKFAGGMAELAAVVVELAVSKIRGETAEEYLRRKFPDIEIVDMTYRRKHP